MRLMDEELKNAGQKSTLKRIFDLEFVPLQKVSTDIREGGRDLQRVNDDDELLYQIRRINN